MKIPKFRIGFVLGYLVATLRHSRDADPVIDKLKDLESRVQDVRAWWNGLDDEHPARRAAVEARSLIGSRR